MLTINMQTNPPGSALLQVGMVKKSGCGLDPDPSPACPTTLQSSLG